MGDTEIKEGGKWEDLTKGFPITSSNNPITNHLVDRLHKKFKDMSLDEIFNYLKLQR